VFAKNLPLYKLRQLYSSESLPDITLKHFLPVWRKHTGAGELRKTSIHRRLQQMIKHSFDDDFLLWQTR